MSAQPGRLHESDGGEPSGPESAPARCGMRDLPGVRSGATEDAHDRQLRAGVTYAAGDTVTGIAAGRIAQRRVSDIVVASGPEPTVYKTVATARSTSSRSRWDNKGDWRVMR